MIHACRKLLGETGRVHIILNPQRQAPVKHRLLETSHQIPAAGLSINDRCHRSPVPTRDLQDGVSDFAIQPHAGHGGTTIPKSNNDDTKECTFRLNEPTLATLGLATWWPPQDRNQHRVSIYHVYKHIVLHVTLLEHVETAIPTRVPSVVLANGSVQPPSEEHYRIVLIEPLVANIHVHGFCCWCNPNVEFRDPSGPNSSEA
mmetsp:Transcript_19643/g.43546  ORF Transcript_19643/g.43546 Transcript_19643/m.43546 type:complete len:202 (-) Transcript_19643:1091-1696(-)